MTRLGLRLGALVGIGLVALAHVGSPDTYFEGAAGPYPVRVVVRNPGVVPSGYSPRTQSGECWCSPCSGTRGPRLPHPPTSQHQSPAIRRFTVRPCGS